MNRFVKQDPRRRLRPPIVGGVGHVMYRVTPVWGNAVKDFGSRPEQAAQDVSPYILNDFRRAVPAMRRGGFGNSCRNCAALVPAYLFSGMKVLNGVWRRGVSSRLNLVPRHGFSR